MIRQLHGKLGISAEVLIWPIRILKAAYHRRWPRHLDL